MISHPQGNICRLTSGSHLITPVVPPNPPPEAPQSAATKLLPQGPGDEFGWNRNPHTAPLVQCGSCHILHWPANTPCPSLAGANCHSGTHTPSTGCRPAMATSLACCNPFLNPSLHCTALIDTLMHYTELHCTALHCTALHCTALHCTALHYTALLCTALHYVCE